MHKCEENLFETALQLTLEIIESNREMRVFVKENLLE